ncbi:hypothetical protein [Pedobacter sp. Hv1]|uniref:hypothetical protein n=1 Tax=Pedobacter sp. Hv1 TaxID=1740090 RepID=UPI0006D8A955|nr:hypothetical protein [Pedobacter sp. Hv1]KQC00392.1 hypothetical protein AQF98_12975 [Pedobacter sp. Hv1]
MAKDLKNYFAEQEKIMTERRTKLKNGPNVIHLSYLSQHISPLQLLEMEAETERLGFQLSSMDRSGTIQASISSLSADLVLMLTEPGIIGVLMSGLLTNGIYDGLKMLIISCWKKVYNKKTISIISNTVLEHPAKFHLVIKLDVDCSIELETENLDAEQFGVAIDKISDIAKDLNSKKRSLMLFDPLELKWNPIKVDIDFLKQGQKLTREIPLEEYLEELRKKENPED